MMIFLELFFKIFIGFDANVFESVKNAPTVFLRVDRNEMGEKKATIVKFLTRKLIIDKFVLFFGEFYPLMWSGVSSGELWKCVGESGKLRFFSSSFCHRIFFTRFSIKFWLKFFCILIKINEKCFWFRLTLNQNCRN